MVESDGRDSGDVVRAAVDEAYKFGRCAYTYAVRCERFGKAYRQCGSPAEVAVGASMYCKQHAAGAASALLRLSSYGRDPA